MNFSKETTDNKPKTFEDLNIPINLLRGIYGFGYETPSDIQLQAIPIIKSGRDLIAQSMAGTGKTGAFSIASLSMINEKIEQCQVIVLSPTRELASQTSDVYNSIGEYLKIRIHLSIGGKSTKDDANEIRKGIHVSVCTPGRIKFLIDKDILKLDQLKLIILDEADELLGRGFVDDIEFIMKKIPFDCQVALFSGTIDEHVLKLAKKFMKDPEYIKLVSNEHQLNNISQFYIGIEQQWKFDTLLVLYESLEIQQCVIYCNTKECVDDLCSKLKEKNFAVSKLHANLTPPEREEIMKDFRVGTSRVLISSDLISRGIDVQQISLIINYDLPKKHEIYIHRIGRTGRFNKKGFAVSFVTPDDEKNFKIIESNLKLEIKELPQDVGFIN